MGGVSGIYDKPGGVLSVRDLSGDPKVAAPHPDRLEQANLTFEDPQLNANGEPHSSHAGLHSPHKQKLDDSPKHPCG
ncbi:hypothetical protein CR513_02734, partial [Mucuna pruriens]